MRILVYGAGNIGSLYAARLAAASHDVSILARGKRLAQIRERGIQLEHGVTGERTTTFLPVVSELSARDAYDLVLIAVPGHCISEVLPVLAANQNTPSLMFFGNNTAGTDSLTSSLGRERVLLGFPGAAALAQGEVIRFIVTSAREQPTTIGELDGRRSERIVAIAAALKDARFPVSICRNMDAWLKTHAAEILPTVAALYREGGDLEQLARADASLLLMVRAIREGYRVIRANGSPILPAKHRVFEWAPERLLVAAMRHLVKDKTAPIKFGHATGGQVEWQFLANAFQSLR